MHEVVVPNALQWNVLPFPVLPFPVLPVTVVPFPGLPVPVLFCPAFPYSAFCLFCLSLFCLTFPCFAFPCLCQCVGWDLESCMAVAWLSLTNSFCHHWLQVAVLVQLHVWPIQCESYMLLYFWLRPYQDTGLCIHSSIHPWAHEQMDHCTHAWIHLSLWSSCMMQLASFTSLRYYAVLRTCLRYYAVLRTSQRYYAVLHTCLRYYAVLRT